MIFKNNFLDIVEKMISKQYKVLIFRDTSCFEKNNFNYKILQSSQKFL